MNLKISTDFSYTPGPRYANEGEFSGELFRRDFLLPAIKEAISKNEILTIDLDGTAGYGRSFLEEAFGGLIRKDKLSYQAVVDHMKIISDEEKYLREKLYYYLKEAHEQEKVVT